MKGWLCVAAFAVAGIAGPTAAAVLVDTDFTRERAGWSVRPTARIAPTGQDSPAQVLQITRNLTFQAGAAWTELRARVPSFSFFADIRVRFTPSPTFPCPADGFTLAFAPVETDAVGAWGSSLGLAGNELEIRQFIALEVNTWYGQGLGSAAERQNCVSGKHETFAFDVVRPNQARTEAARTQGGGTPEKGGFKIGQTLPPSGMQIVNGGWYRYQWNVEADGTMAVYVTGLEARSRGFQRVKVLETKLARNPLDLFDGRWGITAGTSGLVQTVEVARVTIESPAVGPR
jgi:hypothetical protein